MTPPSSLSLALGSPSDHRTAQEIVLQRLRGAIISGALPGGARLLQQEIARELGVSTTPVREALRTLATEGLVQFDAHQGAIVAQLAIGDAIDIYQLRIVVEAHAMRLAAERITQDELTRAGELLEKLNRERTLSRWIELHRGFHNVLIEASRSNHTIRIAEQLRSACTMFLRGELATHSEPPNTRQEHKMLLDACRRQDPQLASDIITRHLQTSLNELLKRQQAVVPGNKRAAKTTTTAGDQRRGTLSSGR